MRKGALFVFAIFARFSLDSARTKIPIAKMAASQKINRAALDIFILLVFFYAPAFGISLCRNAADALRFSNRNIAQTPEKKASGIFKQQRQDLSNVAIKGNRPVTNEM
jgi:N-formylglutamate amidohydrolase